MKKNEIDRLNIPRYKVRSFYSREIQHGGGVMIMSKSHLELKKIIIPSINNLIVEQEFECCLVEIKGFKFSCALIAVYRTPRFIFERNFLMKLNILLCIILKHFEKVIISGDINIDVLSDSNAYRELEIILKSHNMYYAVDFPTRISNTKQSAIDNYLTNILKSTIKVSGCITALSDHDGQILQIQSYNANKNENKIVHFFKRNYDVHSMSTFKYMLSKEKWSEVYQSQADKKFDVFFSIFMYYFNMNFPKIKSRHYVDKKNWINYDLIREKEQIINSIQNNRKYGNVVTNEGETSIKSRFKEFRKHVKMVKHSYYDKLIQKTDNVIKTTWNIINKEVGCKSVSNKNIVLNCNDTEVKDPHVVSSMFSDYFGNMVDQHAVPSITCHSNNDSVKDFTTKKFTFTPLTEKDMESIILSFDNRGSNGFDGVPMTVIKFAKEFLLRPLTHLINSSFITGEFPNKLKISKIKPLSKSGDTHNISDYRPISLLSSFSKLYERAVKQQLFMFLESNNLFDKEQHGFQGGKSVITAGINFIESIIDAIEKKEKVVGIFMDLSKAFDRVSHSQLLLTLSKLGIKGRSLSWFQSYLANRAQFVEISHLDRKNYLSSVVSPTLTVNHGVPQGSILGPLLFLCYLKGLPDIIEGKSTTMHLYADDINLKVSCDSVSDLEIKCFIDLALVSQCLSEKQLLLNTDKTKFVSFSASQNRNKFLSKYNILINDSFLEEVNNTKHLGLVIDKHLNWNLHINKICSKIASGLYALRQMYHISNINTLKSIYHAFIHAHIAFGISLYGSTSNQNMNKILILQKKAIRIMLHLKWNESVKTLFPILGILTVYSVYIFETIIHVKKNFCYIPKMGANHKYHTRNRNNLAFTPHTLEFYKKKPSYSGITFYNKLPSDLKNISDFNIFKKKLKRYLLDKALYSLDEFLEND